MSLHTLSQSSLRKRSSTHQVLNNFHTLIVLSKPFVFIALLDSIHLKSKLYTNVCNSIIQTYLSWGGAVPVNISLTLNKLNSNVGRACVLLSAKRVCRSSACLKVKICGECTVLEHHVHVCCCSWRCLPEGAAYQLVMGEICIHRLQMWHGTTRVSDKAWHTRYSASSLPTGALKLLMLFQTQIRKKLGQYGEQKYKNESSYF